MQIKKEQVNEKLKEAALCEFASKGYKGASMRSIAQIAGMSASNIYSYYKGKDELFEDILKDATDNIMLYLSRVSKGMPRSLGTIEYLGSSITELFIRYKTQFMIMMSGSDGSRYENIRQSLTRGIAQRLMTDYFDKASTDPILINAVANALLSGLFTFFESCPNDEKRLLMLTKSFLKMLFSEIENMESGK